MEVKIIIEISTFIIAISSLLISFYLIHRDRKQKQYDVLYQFRNRIIDLHRQQEKESPTVDERVFNAENPESDEAQNAKLASFSRSSEIDRELEFVSYLTIKRRINREVFYHIFKGWLLGRYLFWTEMQQYKIPNNPYTWKLITYYKKKGLIPLKSNGNKKAQATPELLYS
ncbi:MAG: hypothetical protein ACNS60_20430 [Candidatus Cyclobacteriaceae bacterium M2_1C_046]